MDFVESLGPAFLAHRLRRHSDALVDQVGAAFAGAGLKVPPRSLSTLLLLRERGALGPVEIGRALRFSHPLMVRSLRTLEELGLVAAIPDPADQRRRRVELTGTGRDEAERGARLIAAIGRRLEARARGAGVDLEALLGQLDTLSRAIAERPLGLD